MTVDKHTLAELQPVIESARKVLADMEHDDIPASLRKVAKSSARTLPPPFAKSVIRELTNSERFRQSVSEQYEEKNPVDEDLVAFLADPEQGMDRIAERANASKDLEKQTDLRSANRRIAELGASLAEAKARISALRAQHVGELADARSSVSDGQIRAEARVEKLASALSAKDDEVKALTEELGGLADELASAEGRLISAVERGRRRQDPANRSPQGLRSDATPSDPLELALWLDNIERNMRPYREREEAGVAAASVDPLRVDPGIAPDSGSALASLVEQRPSRFILDGYNIAGEINASGFSTRVARDDVIRRAGRLARSTEAEVLVVFDGPDDEGRSGFRSMDGVLVRFSRGNKADDVIAALVASDPTGTVVVTNDRELRSRCTVDGCIPIWSTAFLEWG